jgi:hypothetical protein
MPTPQPVIADCGFILQRFIPPFTLAVTFPLIFPADPFRHNMARLPPFFFAISAYKGAHMHGAQNEREEQYQ